MYRKCYPIANAFNGWEETNLMQNAPKWRIFERISEQCYVMCATFDDYVRYAPLFLHSFRLIAPRKLLEAQQLNRRYHRYEEINNVQDRIRC